MTNDKWQFVVGTSDFYLSLVICHWSFVIGHLSLVICHWSFVIGHSLPEDLIFQAILFVDGVMMIGRNISELLRDAAGPTHLDQIDLRSEERRVGKECRYCWC